MNNTSDDLVIRTETAEIQEIRLSDYVPDLNAPDPAEQKSTRPTVKATHHAPAQVVPRVTEPLIVQPAPQHNFTADPEPVQRPAGANRNQDAQAVMERAMNQMGRSGARALQHSMSGAPRTPNQETIDAINSPAESGAYEAAQQLFDAIASDSDSDPEDLAEEAPQPNYDVSKVAEQMSARHPSARPDDPAPEQTTIPIAGLSPSAPKAQSPQPMTRPRTGQIMQNPVLSNQPPHGVRPQLSCSPATELQALFVAEQKAPEPQPIAEAPLLEEQEYTEADMEELKELLPPEELEQVWARIREKAAEMEVKVIIPQQIIKQPEQTLDVPAPALHVTEADLEPPVPDAALLELLSETKIAPAPLYLSGTASFPENATQSGSYTIRVMDSQGIILDEVELSLYTALIEIAALMQEQRPHWERSPMVFNSYPMEPKINKVAAVIRTITEKSPFAVHIGHYPHLNLRYGVHTSPAHNAGLLYHNTQDTQTLYELFFAYSPIPETNKLYLIALEASHSKAIPLQTLNSTWVAQ